MISKPILYAEDDENDAFFMQRAMDEIGVLNPLTIVTDGEAVINYLCAQNEFSNRDRFPIPSLMILDLKMPKKTGLEVLEWIQADGRFRNISALVLSSSTLLTDIKAAYAVGASSYLIKPKTYSELKSLVTKVRDSWIKPSKSFTDAGGSKE